MTGMATDSEFHLLANDDVAYRQLSASGILGRFGLNHLIADCY
jgi:hypothetical protein